MLKYQRSMKDPFHFQIQKYPLEKIRYDDNHVNKIVANP